MKIILASLRFHYRNLHSSFCQLRQTYKTSIEIVFNFVNHNNLKKIFSALKNQSAFCHHTLRHIVVPAFSCHL